MHKSEKGTAIAWLSNSGYILVCAVLYLIAFWIIIGSVWSIIYDAIYESDFTVYYLLDEVALIIFSIAIIDVAKYIMIEEVIIGQRYKETPKKARQTLTKFIIIIATALSLEGLVLTIEVAKTDIQKILYPVSLLIVGGFLIIGLGIYQKLNASAESEAGPK